MFASRTSAALLAVIAGGLLLQPSRAAAQWWSRAPADFEECADQAEKAATKEDKATQLAACNAKYAGRRKPGGGYTYYDFMQNRSFDIAGPNPTPEEQRKIDEQYTAFLEQERRKRIAAAFAAKQQLLQQASLSNEKVPLPPEPPHRPLPAANELRPHAKSACARHTFSCDWPRLSEGWKELKKLFSSSPTKAKRG